MNMNEVVLQKDQIASCTAIAIFAKVRSAFVVKSGFHMCLSLISTTNIVMLKTITMSLCICADYSKKSRSALRRG